MVTPDDFPARCQSPRWIGIDLHKTVVHVTVPEPDQHLVTDFEFNLQKVSTPFWVSCGCGPTTTWPWKRPQTLDTSCDGFGSAWWTAACPWPTLGNSGSCSDRSDRNDSYLLALTLMLGLLSEVWIPDDKTYEDRELLTHRGHLIQQQTACKNRIRAILRANNLLLDSSDIQTRDGCKFLADVRLKLPTVPRIKLENLLEQLECFDTQLQRLDAQIITRSQETVEVELLLTIRGCQDLTAMAMMAAIGTISRFHSPGSLANYAGLAPRTPSSAGRSTGRARTSKEGNRLLRWASTTIAQGLIRGKGQVANLYRRLRRRGKDHGLALAACARELLVIVWHMLTKGEPYRERDLELEARKHRRRQACLKKARALPKQPRRDADHLAVLMDLATCRQLDSKGGLRLLGWTRLRSDLGRAVEKRSNETPARLAAGTTLVPA